MNLPHGGVGLSINFSRGMNSSSGEFILPFGESFMFLENQLYYFVPSYIPSEFLLKGGSVQTAAHSFFNLSTRNQTIFRDPYLSWREFSLFLNSINAFRPKLAVLTEATGGKGSSSIAIASFLSGNLSILLLILSCMTFLKPQHSLVVWFHELWYLQ